MKRFVLRTVTTASAAVCCVLAAQFALAGDPEKPTPLPPKPTADLLTKLRAEQKARARAADKERREFEEALKSSAMAFGLKRRTPLPRPIPSERRDTVSTAVPHGLAWLIAHQNGDGAWPGRPELSALGFLLLVPNEFEGDEFIDSAGVASLRIGIFQTDDVRSKLMESCRGARGLATALSAECVELLGSSDQIVRLHERLVHEVSNPKSKYDRLDAAWAQFALLNMAESSNGPEEFKRWIVRRPDESSGPKGSLDRILKLQRLQAQEDGPNDDSIVETARRIAESADAKTGRSLDEWFLGAVALKSADEAAWRKWCEVMVPVVLAAQKDSGAWCDGRKSVRESVRSTTLALLCLWESRHPW